MNVVAAAGHLVRDLRFNGPRSNATQRSRGLQPWLSRRIVYIEQNPVKAGLCITREQWPRSSAALGTRRRVSLELTISAALASRYRHSPQ